jgi:O-acetyl-ADP-ribose deacetylase
MTDSRSVRTIHSTRLEVLKGDLLRQPVDAIVNAANASLQHGGGVAGAILRGGGMQIQRESDEWIRVNGRVAHAHPAYTGAGVLPFRYIIHAVGPIWGQGDEDRKLTDAVRGTLELAAKLELKSVALPAISTGIYGFPRERAARIILMTEIDWLSHHPHSGLTLVMNVLYDQTTCDLFSAELEAQLP